MTTKDPHQKPVYVEFTGNFDYIPSQKPQVTYAYPKGYSGIVKHECAERAVAAGKAIYINEVKNNGETTNSGADEPTGKASKTS